MKKYLLAGLIIASCLMLAGCQKQSTVQKDTSGSKETPANVQDSEEGTCTICLTGSSCYDSPTTLFTALPKESWAKMVQ